VRSWSARTWRTHERHPPVSPPGTPAEGRRGRRAAGAVVAPVVAGSGAVAAALPASADVVDPRQDSTTVSWVCADPLPSNPAWVLLSSEYSAGSVYGSLPAASPFTADPGIPGGRHVRREPDLYLRAGVGPR
jgi:hypothetical protein